MRNLWPTLLLLSNFIIPSIQTNNDPGKLPTVFVAIFIRNRAAVLPYFLTYFSRLEYPKDRLRIRIYSNSGDNETAEILKIWTKTWESQYHSIDSETGKLVVSDDEEDLYTRLIQLREEALEAARFLWADYAWFLDCDALLTNQHTLTNLIQHNLVVVAPMLLSDEMYSNFWCGMTSSYYYKRTEEYPQILYRKKMGCFAVPMVHSAVLINLRSRSSDSLTFVPEKVVDYNGPIDDIITFAVGANQSGVPMYICNDEKYGYITALLDQNATITDDRNNLLNLKLSISVDDPPLELDDSLSTFVSLPPKTKFGFDEIYVINLARRHERRIRMKYCLDELGMDTKFLEAVDGRSLEDEDLDRMGITLMPNYEDPYHKRPMKKGEIGCFLSHYNIWREVINRNLSHVLILEDDVRFERNFIQKLEYLVHEMQHFSSLWDLIYIGRKIMRPDAENDLDGSNYLVYPDYTYWTIGYVLNRDGAEKLVRAEPLSKLLPVDEFLPIMYDKHPKIDWKAHFPTRDLRALSVDPLIVFPMKYTYEEGYLSDTEDSHVVSTCKNRKASVEL